MKNTKEQNQVSYRSGVTIPQLRFMRQAASQRGAWCGWGNEARTRRALEARGIVVSVDGRYHLTDHGKVVLQTAQRVALESVMG
jgi:hypothetical protein